MGQLKTTTNVKRAISEHLSQLKSQRELESKVWNSEKRKMLDRCLVSTNRLESILKKAKNMLRGIFTDPAAKDELFKLFYGYQLVHGRFMLLPIFSVDRNVEEVSNLDFDNQNRLALAWDVCKGVITFKIINDISNSHGTGQTVFNNFFSKEDIKDTRQEFLNSDRTKKKSLEEMIDSYNSENAKFIDLLIHSDLLRSEKAFFEKILRMYEDELTKDTVQKICYSRRIRKIIRFGEGKFVDINDAIMGEQDSVARNLREMIERLSSEGCPDAQKAYVDICPYWDLDDKPKMKLVTVGFIRRNYEDWKREGLFEDEIRSFDQSIVLND